MQLEKEKSQTKITKKLSVNSLLRLADNGRLTNYVCAKLIKTIKDVPARIRDQVKQVLIDLDLPELAEE